MLVITRKPTAPDWDPGNVDIINYNVHQLGGYMTVVETNYVNFIRNCKIALCKTFTHFARLIKITLLMIKSSTVIMFCCILFVSKVSTTKLLPLLRNSRIISTGKVPLQRLERIINNRGAGSRTEITKLLRQGRIKVNGKTVRGTGQYLSNVEITVDNEILPEIPLLAKYYKPVGIVW